MPVNIGNPSEITIMQFAHEILALVNNKEAHIIYNPLPVDDPKQRQPDITRAREILGWQPEVDREEGLLRTYEYFKSVVQRSNQNL